MKIEEVMSEKEITDAIERIASVTPDTWAAIVNGLHRAANVVALVSVEPSNRRRLELLWEMNEDMMDTMSKIPGVIEP